MFDTASRSLMQQVRRFADDRRAVSAIEFAVIAPLMITIYLGGVEVSQAVAVNRKTTIVAHTVADLVAQVAKVTDADMQDVLNASSSVATPYGISNLTVTVSCLDIDNTGVAKVKWSDTMHGTARTPNTTVTVDPALADPRRSVVCLHADLRQDHHRHAYAQRQGLSAAAGVEFRGAFGDLNTPLTRLAVP
jgi:Flp pilus assembly protein TadG